jgi:hypothetical protein
MSTHETDAPAKWFVKGCRVDGVVYDFPHIHPEQDCAVCAYLRARHEREREARRVG